MNIQEFDIVPSELSTNINDRVIEGYKLASMYVQEPSETDSRRLEIIMISEKDVLRISSCISDSFDSLSKIIPSELYEREIYEMSNVIPKDHWDLQPLKIRYKLKDAYPLQKESIGTSEKYRLPIQHNGMDGDGIFEIPVGPIHAGIIEPNHLRFSVAGEPILMLKVHLGYTHRGIEKLMETDISKDNTHLAERICGDNGIAHSLAYLQAIERDTEIPKRAKFIRTILAELERIHCHLSGISGVALDTALSVPAAEGFALRERMLRLNEKVSGHRLLRGILKPGGLKKDLDNRQLEMIEKETMALKFEICDLFEMMIRSPSFMDRAESTGVLSENDAKRFGTVGPIARASGIEYDVRKQHPYEAYADVGFRVPVYTSGDVYSRLRVKKEEIEESISLISQCIGFMEAGPIFEKLKIINGFSFGIVESPRGELTNCVHVKNDQIWRYKIRDASFHNWPALETAVLGNIIPDFPLINKSFDLSCSGNDL